MGNPRVEGVLWRGRHAADLRHRAADRSGRDSRVQPAAEASELVVVDAPRDDIVFPLDAEVITGFRLS